MTHGKDPYPLPLANRTLPWVVQREQEGGGGCVICEREKGEGGGLWSKNAAKTKTVNFNIYTHCFGERKELEVGHCVSGLQQNNRRNREHPSGAERKTERESVVNSGQLRIHWIEMCSNKSARKGVVQNFDSRLHEKCFAVRPNKRK